MYAVCVCVVETTKENRKAERKRVRERVGRTRRYSMILFLPSIHSLEIIR